MCSGEMLTMANAVAGRIALGDIGELALGIDGDARHRHALFEIAGSVVSKSGCPMTAMA